MNRTVKYIKLIIMEEQILKKINRSLLTNKKLNDGLKESAKEIESHIMDFIAWYSGMEKDKIKRAYNRWLTVEKINMKIP